MNTPLSPSESVDVLRRHISQLMASGACEAYALAHTSTEFGVPLEQVRYFWRGV